MWGMPSAGTCGSPGATLKFRPVLVHACFDQRLGQLRPPTCRCRYRISVDEANEHVAQGRADWVIVDWRNGFPVEGSNLVWGARPEKQREKDEKLSSAYALKTPRVHTLEKADLERAYVNGKQDDLDRIQAWGELAREVIAELTKPWDGHDPFEGRAVCYLPGLGQRVAGKDTHRDMDND